MATPPFTNRLINEKSPYLQQHAHNPVDWYPWGDEAFYAAQKADKPIFLSIGYATCHWCHVMEKESFENAELAQLMNETFVCIKVDREELPHVDSLYMEFAQALMGTSAGWPLNVILTPELKPFFAVTYLPLHSRQGLIGFDQFILQIKQLWQSDEKEQLIEQANKLVEAFAKSVEIAGEELPTEEYIEDAVELLFQLADPVFGGLKGEPKFPLGYQSEFLMQYAKAHEDSRALFYVELTLEMMCRGGIYDHLGGGFSRYAIDERWIVPHFEKMSYDNAILAKTYIEAWKYTKRPLFRRIAEETLQYVQREMTGPDGSFYSGQDADTEGHEGRYYTWTPEEISAVLSPEDAQLFCRYYGVTKEGNFEGRNVLHVAAPLEELVENRKELIEEFSHRLASARAALFKKRETRPKPFKDDKILACWNGLMIDAFAHAGAAFENAQFSEAAMKAARFIRSKLWLEGRLLRRYREGEAKFPAALEDYAFLIKGLLSLFDLGLGNEWLKWAIELADVLFDKYKAPKGAFYHTLEEEGMSAALLRKCEFYDGAEPSGNAVHCENLLRLFQLTKDERYLRQAEDVLKAVEGYMEAYPPGACYHLMALSRYLDVKAPTLVVAFNEKRSLEKEITGWLREQFCPHLEVIWKRNSDIDSLLPEDKDKTPIEGETAVYICRQNACEPALTDKNLIEKAILSL